LQRESERQAEELRRGNAATHISRIVRGKLQRKKFAVMYGEWQESERLRIKAEAEAMLRARMRRENNAATAMQRLLRGWLGRRRSKERAAFLREQARQAVMFEEQVPYEECVRVSALEFVPYYVKAVEDAALISEAQEIAAEQARSALKKRRAAGRLEGDLITMHGDLRYVTIEQLHEMVESTAQLAKDNMILESESARETILNALREAASTCKAVLAKVKPENFYSIQSERERKRLQKECGYLEAGVKVLNLIMLDEEKVEVLGASPQGLVEEMVMVMGSQKHKGNNDAAVMLGLIIDKAKLALKIEWEHLSIRNEIARKDQQYTAYRLDREACELMELVHTKLHNDGLEEEAETLKEKFQKVVETEWRGLAGKRAVSSLNKFAKKTKATVGVPAEYGDALVSVAAAVEEGYQNYATWEDLEEDRQTWLGVRDYIRRAPHLQEQLMAINKQDDAKGMALHQASVDAWQLSMALYDTGDRDRAEQLQQFGLDMRSRAHSTLQSEINEIASDTSKALTKAKVAGQEVVDVFVRALATDEASEIKKEMVVVDQATAGVVVPEALIVVDQNLRALAKQLKDDDGQAGADSDEEMNELDAGDIESLNELADVITDARGAWEFELKQVATLNQVREDHFRKAFGPRPASRAETPAWPLQPWPEKPLDPISDEVNLELGRGIGSSDDTD